MNLDNGRKEGCLSDLALDRGFAGEHSDEERATVAAHLATCSDCRERHTELRSARDVFLVARATSGLPRRTPVRPKAIYAGTAFLAAAAALVLFIQSRGAEHGGETRRKGGAHVGFFVQRGVATERGREEQPMRPGDRVRFTYTAERPTHLAIYALDAAGTASVFFPAGDGAERLPAGVDVPLSSMVQLDETLGAERVFALFCDTTFPLAPLREELALKKALRTPDGCQLHSFAWHKETTTQ